MSKISDIIVTPPVGESRTTGMLGAWEGTRGTRLYRVERWANGPPRHYIDGAMVSRQAMPERVWLAAFQALRVFDHPRS